MRKKVFFRDDDVCDVDEKCKKLIGLFLWHRIPVHLAVIPGRLTSRCEVFLRNCTEKYPHLVEIGQHGYRHQNHSLSGTGKFEFGPGRSYAMQKKDIVVGKCLLEKTFGVIDVFTPPWHGWDDHTLRALVDAGFRGVSTDVKSKIPEGASVLQNILTQVHFNKRDVAGRWFVEKPDRAVTEILAVPGERAGVLLHHDKFNDERELDELHALLVRLKENPLVSFCSLSSGVRRSSVSG